jgi:hypothetical protein
MALPSTLLTVTTTNALNTGTAANSTTFSLATSNGRPVANDDAPGKISGSHSSSTPASSNPNTSDPDDDGQDPRGSLLNYYFVFLALFLALLFLGVYGLHRRRKIKKARLQNNRQTALARDVDGWAPNSRRWVQGSWASRFDRHNRFGTRALEQDSEEEGLDEYGDAPPPYKARTSGERGTQTGVAAAGPGLGGNMPTVPLRTLSRGAVGKPPGYEETLGNSTAPEANNPPSSTTPSNATENR